MASVCTDFKKSPLEVLIVIANLQYIFETLIEALLKVLQRGELDEFPLLILEQTVEFKTVVQPNTVLAGACNGRQPFPDQNGCLIKRRYNDRFILKFPPASFTQHKLRREPPTSDKP